MKKKLLIIISVCAMAAILVAATPWTSRQTKAHEMAEIARELGLPEDNPIIEEAQFLWWCDTEDARILAAVNEGECKYCSDRAQQLTSCTVLNRVKDNSGNFPNTIKGVVGQTGQYSMDYIRNLPDYFTADADTQRCFRNAYAAFMGVVECPQNVIYASEFPPSVLGSGTYDTYRYYVNGVLVSITYFNFR